jgi:hypothetical protein
MAKPKVYEATNKANTHYEIIKQAITTLGSCEVTQIANMVSRNPAWKINGGSQSLAALEKQIHTYLPYLIRDGYVRVK